MLYEHGRGIGQDDVSAYMWYTLAIQQGSSNAEHDRERLEKTMTTAQIEYAQHSANVWNSRQNTKQVNSSMPKLR